jgi:hypothetical protein
MSFSQGFALTEPSSLKNTDPEILLMVGNAQFEVINFFFD